MIPVADSLLWCSHCGRRRMANLEESLRDGFEECHGVTMTLLNTTADIPAATLNVTREQGYVHAYIGAPTSHV